MNLSEIAEDIKTGLLAILCLPMLFILWYASVLMTVKDWIYLAYLKCQMAWLNFRCGPVGDFIHNRIHKPLWHAWNWPRYHKCWSCEYQMAPKHGTRCALCKHNALSGRISSWKPKSGKVERLKEIFATPVDRPFEEIHKEVEQIMGRGVLTHELAYPQYLYDELEGKPVPDPLDKLFKLRTGNEPEEGRKA